MNKNISDIQLDKMLCNLHKVDIPAFEFCADKALETSPAPIRIRKHVPVYITAAAVCLLVVSFVLYNVVSKSDDLNNWESTDASIEENKILDRINNVDSYDNLITQKIDIDEFIQMFDNDPECFLNAFPPRLLLLDKTMGVSCIRKTDAGLIYSVHKVKQGGLLYIFYNISSDEKVHYVRIWYYVQKSLSFEDFANITIGSDINDVEKIDPATSVYIKKFNNSKEQRESIRTFHYLSDGIISYVFEKTDGRLIVSKIDIDDIFLAHDYYSEMQKIIDGRILPIDRIK